MPVYAPGGGGGQQQQVQPQHQVVQGGYTQAPPRTMTPQMPQDLNRLGQVRGQGNWGPGSQWWANHNQQGGMPQGKGHPIMGALGGGQMQDGHVMSPIGRYMGGAGQGTAPGVMQPGASAAPGNTPLNYGVARPQTQAQGGYAQSPGTQANTGATGGGTTPPVGGRAPYPHGTNQIANELQPSYMPQTPMGQASTLSQQQLNSLGPQATIQQILQGALPQFRQAQGALNNQLAAAGLVGGGAEAATDMLQGQEMSSLAPTLANAIQNSQGMQLAGETSNMNAMNQMTGLNLQDIMGTNQFNAQAANQAKAQQAGYTNADWQAQLQAYNSLLSSFMGGGAGMAQGIANNFPIFQNQGLASWLGF